MYETGEGDIDNPSKPPLERGGFVATLHLICTLFYCQSGAGLHYVQSLHSFVVKSA